MIQKIYLLAFAFVFFATIPGMADAMEQKKNTASLGIEAQHHNYLQR